MRQLCIIIGLILIIGCSGFEKERGAIKMDKDKKYFDIARNAIKNMDKDADLKCVDETLVWTQLMSKKKYNHEQAKLFKQLQRKDFVAVSCSPIKMNTLGGSFNVFIDTKTNKVLHVLRGQ